MSQRVIFICYACGSTILRRDAKAMWNTETQRWTLANMFDETYCPCCEGSAEAIEASFPLAIYRDEEGYSVDLADGTMRSYAQPPLDLSWAGIPIEDMREPTAGEAPRTQEQG